MKGDWNQNNWQSFFDATYIINLPKRSDRREQVVKEMNLYGVKYSIWPAIERENGAQGLKETMIELFKNSLANGYKNILVFEDDVQFLESPNAIMPYCLEQLPEDYDIFSLGCNPFQGFDESRSMPNLLRPIRAYGLHAVAYSSGCMNYLLNRSIDTFFPNIEFDSQPLDVWIDNLRLNTYCAYPMIATQRPSYSDIEKRHIDWSFALQDRFNEKTKHLK